jgi:hypothetical protein
MHTIQRPLPSNVFHEFIQTIILFYTGADIVQDDGVYSRYFTSFTKTGYYSVVVDVSDHAGRAVVKETRTVYITSTDGVGDASKQGRCTLAICLKH